MEEQALSAKAALTMARENKDFFMRCAFLKESTALKLTQAQGLLT